MMKTVHVMLAALSIFMTLYFSYMLVDRSGKNHFSCDGEYVGFNEGVRIKTRIYLSLSGTKGEQTMDGEITDRDGQVKKIRRVSQFTFARNNNNYHIVNQTVSDLPGNKVDDDILKVLFPYYVLVPGTSVNVNITRAGGNGYVLSANDHPIYYCKSGS